MKCYCYYCIINRKQFRTSENKSGYVMFTCKQQIFLLSRWLLSVTIKTHDYLEKLVFAHGILL